MDNNHKPPWWVPLLFGSVMIFMGLMIVGLLLGIFPVPRGSQSAPVWVLASIAAGLILGGTLIVIPRGSPAFIRSFLGLCTLVLVAVVCNWTAFAPGVHYTSEVSLGPVSVWGEDQIGGRIAFGLAALAIDVLLVWEIICEVRKRINK